MFNQVSAGPGNKVVTFGADSSVLNASWAQTRDRGKWQGRAPQSWRNSTANSNGRPQKAHLRSPEMWGSSGRGPRWERRWSQRASQCPCLRNRTPTFTLNVTFFWEVVVFFVVEEQQSEWRACFPRWWTVSTLPRPPATPPSTRPRRVLVVGRRLEPPSGHAHHGDATRRPKDCSVAR